MNNYFCTSGIRGVYCPDGLINVDFAYRLGKALADMSDGGRVIIGRDTRLSGPVLRKGLISGLADCEIIDLDIVPTGLVPFAQKTTNSDLGIMITASHNPPRYNGFKLSKKEGMPLSADDELEICTLIDRCSSGFPTSGFSKGIYHMDMDTSYINSIISHVKPGGNMKVLIDCSNGAASNVSPKLLENLGYEIVKINSEFDGTFSGHDPEPIEKNLLKTMKKVVEEKCDIGIVHDGDADRVVFIDEKGRLADQNRMLAYLGSNIFGENGNSGNIVTTVDTSITIEDYIGSRFPGLDIVRTKVGDVFVSNEMLRRKSIFGGEPCGAYIFPEFGLWPDGVYGLVKVLDYLEKGGASLSSVMDSIPDTYNIKRNYRCSNENKQNVIDRLIEYVPGNFNINLVDGILLTDTNSRILIRPSGTEELIRMNIETVDKSLLDPTYNNWDFYVKRVIDSIENKEMVA